MKIAVATSDGEHISPHFGRSAGFLIYDFDRDSLTGGEMRPNRQTAHAKGECSGEGEHHHGDHAHSHEGILAALADCAVVICGGMGWRAAQDLKGHGIEPVVVTEPLSPEEAVKAYLRGAIAPTEGFCRCHEAH